MRKGRPPSRPIANPLATTPLSLVTRRRCSSPGPSQGTHITSRSTLDLHTLDSVAYVYSVGEAGKNHRTLCSSVSESICGLIRYAHRPSRDFPARTNAEVTLTAGAVCHANPWRTCLTPAWGSYCNRTATGLAHAGTLRTNESLGIVENSLNKSNNRTCRDSL